MYKWKIEHIKLKKLIISCLFKIKMYKWIIEHIKLKNLWFQKKIINLIRVYQKALINN